VPSGELPDVTKANAAIATTTAKPKFFFFIITFLKRKFYTIFFESPRGILLAEYFCAAKPNCLQTMTVSSQRPILVTIFSYVKYLIFLFIITAFLKF
jgi:hypothetical protein